MWVKILLKETCGKFFDYRTRILCTNSMKIFVTGTRGIPDILGGVETHCQELFPRIAEMGFDITIIRRKSYVKDTMTEYKNVRLIDIETLLKQSYILSRLFLKLNSRKLTLFIFMLSVRLYLCL